MKPLFFVTCVPRCGSQWLARLLDTALDVKVYHNLIKGHSRVDEVKHMLNTWKGVDPRPHLLRSRAKIAQATENQSPGVRGWGETSEFIRYSVPQARELFDVPVAGLIRNGHLTIQSLLRHHFYRPQGGWDWPSAIEPRKDRGDYVLLAGWPNMTSFERCCWLWADSYRRLLDQNVPIFTLESLNAEYGNLERLCDVLGISISYEDWQAAAGKLVDDFYKDRPRPVLSPEQLEMFNRWAGDIQEYFYG